MNNDTISLLQECSAGANMAMSAIDQVLEGVENPALRDALTESRRVHDRIGGETRSLLRAQGQEGKAANPVAQSMAWLKTNWKLTVRPGDETVADLIVDGCNMGVKSLTRYQNQYPAASGHARALAGQLIDAEEQLSNELRRYLCRGNTTSLRLRALTVLFRQCFGLKNLKYCAAVGDEGALRMRQCPSRVHNVCLRFPNLSLRKNLSPNDLDD